MQVTILSSLLLFNSREKLRSMQPQKILVDEVYDFIL